MMIGQTEVLLLVAGFLAGWVAAGRTLFYMGPNKEKYKNAMFAIQWGR